MHPDLIWAVTCERDRDRLARAGARRLAKAVRAARKARRHGDDGDPLAGVRIPGYVDGTFRTGDEERDNVPDTGRPECRTRMAS
ncbi:MAG TPA: hypothetical protein VKV80_10620 [Streptosporangiaceae bacterium]|nr:hypothetical protein [Streptosporangiaceae bacterium]